MSRLVLPDLSRLLPPPASAPVPSPSAAIATLLGRRQFLKAVGATSFALLLPWGRIERALAARRGHFLTARERRTLAALADTIIPRDDAPSASQLGAVDYIERLLSALERTPAAIFAGGPYSGRNPFIDYDTGTPSRKRPKNTFKQFVPLTRLQELYWRWELYGTAALLPADQALVTPLDAQLGGPLRGLRDLYRDGIAALDQLSVAREGKRYSALDAAARVTVRDEARRTFPADPRRGKNFIDLVLTHTLEGCFAAPEYGGNRRSRGWRMTNLDGDSQPLGYALYSRTSQSYRERADRPLSTPNPDEIGNPPVLSPESVTVQDIIVATTGGPGSGC
jgi:Gluconate 2-dehydrogenase subunit 3